MTLFIKNQTCVSASNLIPRLKARILQSNNLLLATQSLGSLEMTVRYSFANNPIIIKQLISVMRKVIIKMK